MASLGQDPAFSTSRSFLGIRREAVFGIEYDLLACDASIEAGSLTTGLNRPRLIEGAEIDVEESE